MLRKKAKKYFIMAFCAAFVIVLACAGAGFTPTAMMLGTAGLLCVATVTLVFMLHASLKTTVYAYKNVSFIGTILFTTPFAVTLLVKFIVSLFGSAPTGKDVFLSLIDYPKQFAFVSALVILAIDLMVAASNVALMRHEGVNLHNALGPILAVLYFGGAALVMLLPRIIAAVIPDPKGFAAILLGTVVPVFFLLLLCYLQGTFIGALVMGWVAARKVPAYDKDYIIILGCSINKKGGLLPLLKGRVNRAIRFAWEQEIATGRPLKYVPSGGQGPDEVMSEGSAMELYLLTRGAEDYEVFPEKKSTTTLENMRFSKKVIDELKPDASIAFATTNYHILRSGMLARRAGIENPEGIAGDTKWYFWPNGFMREFVAILSMHKKAHLIVTAAAAFVALAAGIVAEML